MRKKQSVLKSKNRSAVLVPKWRLCNDSLSLYSAFCNIPPLYVYVCMSYQVSDIVRHVLSSYSQVHKTTDEASNLLNLF